MNNIEELHVRFQKSLTLAVMAGVIGKSESEYQKGWLDGFFRTYIMMTGNSEDYLIDSVNHKLDSLGSSKRLMA